MPKRFFLLLFVILLAARPGKSQELNFRKLTSDNGLSHNTVYNILQDSKGFLWFATREGLNRYDSYHIKNYYINGSHNGSTANRISCLLNLEQKIYIGTDDGLYIYDAATDQIAPCAGFNKHVPILSVTNIGRTLYIGTGNGLYKLSPSGNSKLITPDDRAVIAVKCSASTLLTAAGNHVMIVSVDGRVLTDLTNPHLPELKQRNFNVFSMTDEPDADWLCTNYGLYRYSKTTHTLSRFSFTTTENTESNTVRAITRNQNRLFIGTENGLYVYDELQHKCVNYTQSFDNNPKKLNDKAVYSAFTAADGSVWLGTYFGGVNYIPSSSYGFKMILPSEQPKQLNGKAISQLMEDAHGSIWIATEDGGISIYHPHEQTFDNINQHSHPFHLDINNVHALYDDGQGNIWAGTFLGGLHRFNRNKGTTSIYRNLSSDQIYAIYRDHRGVLWVGTQHGLNTFDYQTGRFNLFKAEQFGQEFIYDIKEDKKGNIWFCSRWNGIFCYQPNTDKITHYTATGQRGSLSSNQVINIFEDSRQQLWFGTLDGGVCVFNYNSNQFHCLNTTNGLPNNNVYGILEDNDHKLWFSTNRGLSCYNPSNHKFTNYDNRYGLPSNQFNFKSALRGHDGTLYFGTVHGLCYFNPASIKAPTHMLPLRFTEFQLFNQPVKPQPSGILNQDIDNAGTIKLSYTQNVLSIGYAALNYSNVRGNNYGYYLEGFEHKWNIGRDKNTATYTSLSPGKYVFHVRALDADGKPLSVERKLNIVVAPPFYLSPVAFIVYELLLCGALFLYARFVKFIHKQKLEVQLERIEKEKTTVLAQHRLNFFTFISHEFKTPLTLIIASVDRFIAEHEFDVKRSSDLSIIKNNAGRLFRMIQQLMEFRKIETDHAEIKFLREDLVAFARQATSSFNTLAVSKGLDLSFSTTNTVFDCYFDADKFEKIVFNLLSNAVKNTASGKIDVRLEMNQHNERESLAILTVSDTGKGMSKKDAENIFNTFYKDISSEESSGVGMALVKSLVTYLNGEITVESDLGVGTMVRVSLPVYRSVNQTEAPELLQPIFTEVPQQASRPVVTAIADAQQERSQKLLIVEDNKELLVFLSEHLGRSYQIIPASNGQSGYNKLIKQMPDLVISDVKMPKMDGITLCQKIKSDAKYSHIPVILLSDNTRENIKLDGLDVGADAYLAKPFNLKELELLVTNMIRSRVNLREQLLDLSKFGLDKLPRNNKDQEFLSNLSQVLERQFGNVEFNIEQMADELNISRTLLHLNLKRILDKSANQLLNEYRLKKAALMLESNLPINEVAYFCGYGDPNYFSRVFKKHFQVSPGAYREQFQQQLNVTDAF
jgi:ligand-binding sensor domain-containing protein/signal transduction histidine kinase/DNA-binding response OmpR family regulator